MVASADYASRRAMVPIAPGRVGGGARGRRWPFGRRARRSLLVVA